MNIKHRSTGKHAAALTGALMLAMACGPLSVKAFTETPHRAVSINLCTDQLLLALAEPSQIAGLGRFARNVEMSFMAASAGAYPVLKGAAEEVLHVRADLVLAGSYSGRATRDVLAARGVKVETFAPPRNLGEAMAEIERAGRLLGAAERTARMMAEIDAAVADAKRASAAVPKAPLVLAMQRRAYVSGTDTLLAAAMEVAGFRNAAVELGISGVGHLSLETIAKMPLDALIIEDLPVSRDQSSAILNHPVLRANGRLRVIKLPVAELTCGGPGLASLIRRLSAALRGP